LGNNKTYKDRHNFVKQNSTTKTCSIRGKKLKWKKRGTGVRGNKKNSTNLPMGTTLKIHVTPLTPPLPPFSLAILLLLFLVQVPLCAAILLLGMHTKLGWTFGWGRNLSEDLTMIVDRIKFKPCWFCSITSLNGHYE
jgi:hypothetical protein